MCYHSINRVVVVVVVFVVVVVIVDVKVSITKFEGHLICYIGQHHLIFGVQFIIHWYVLYTVQNRDVLTIT